MSEAPRRSVIRKVARWCVQGVVIVIAILATLVLVQAFASRRMPDLEAWHHADPATEFEVNHVGPGYGLPEYLRTEDAVFTALGQYMVPDDDLRGISPYSRFVRGGAQDPGGQARDWNRTVELAPETPAVGGVLLLHGLSDSPYSMRSLAEFFLARGYYVLVMRMPGHGTVPAGLLEVTWADWAAAVEVGARHVQSRIDASSPFCIGGYSNGGALAVQYALAALDDADRVPDHLFLFSPAIGITPFARLARWDALYGFIPYFEKSRWFDIEVEYDPYKYNSFTKNAGSQSWRLARAIQTQLDGLQTDGRLGDVPPILTFQSVVDDTVDVEALIAGLYDRLESDGSEVVFFDVNRSSQLEGFVSLDFAERLEALIQRADLQYAVTRIGNRHDSTRAVHAETRHPGGQAIDAHDIDLEWPEGVFSLAHVAIPFPEDDPLYGAAPTTPARFGLHIGSLAPRGERRVLSIPASQLIRIRHNPFHGEMLRRIGRVLDALATVRHDDG